MLRTSIIRLAYSLPKGSNGRRELLALLKEGDAPVIEDESQSETGKGPGKGPGKLMLRFLEEVGDQKVRNPDTDNQVKVTTLSSKPKDSRAYKLFLSEFERWKENLEKTEDKSEGGEKPSEGVSEEKAKIKEEKKEKKEKTPKKTTIFEWEPNPSSFGKTQNKSRSKWTYPQFNAVKAYTGSAYGDINRSLRRGELGGSYSEEVEEMDKLFASPQGKLNRNVMVRRSISSQHPLVQMAESGDLEPGMSFVDLGYQSTTVKKDFNFGSNDYSFEIEVPKGSQAVYVGPPPDRFTAYPHEMELILNRGSKLEILGVEGKVIKARVVNKE